MIDRNDIRTRLRALVDKRNYFFKDTRIEDALKYLKTKTDFQGMATPEIIELEQRINKHFPDDFKTYLSAFGKNCGELFCNGQDLHVTEFAEYQTEAKELLEQHNITPFLTDSSFVFSFHQGYNFYFFNGNKNDDTVYFYMEGEPEPVKAYDSFAELIESQVQELEQYNEQSQTSEGHFITITGQRISMTWPSGKEKSARETGDKYL